MKINRQTVSERISFWGTGAENVDVKKNAAQSLTSKYVETVQLGSSAAKLCAKAVPAIQMDVENIDDDDDDGDGTKGHIFRHKGAYGGGAEFESVYNVYSCVFVGHYMWKTNIFPRFKVRLLIQMYA